MFGSNCAQNFSESSHLNRAVPKPKSRIHFWMSWLYKSTYIWDLDRASLWCEEMGPVPQQELIWSERCPNSGERREFHFGSTCVQQLSKNSLVDRKRSPQVKRVVAFDSTCVSKPKRQLTFGSADIIIKTNVAP